MSAPTNKICRKCGSEIQSASFARSGEHYCCESCYLAPRENSDFSTAVQIEAAFAEALVATLDLREHETGLHSKRVACHALELAKGDHRATREQLRQVYWGALLHDLGKIGISDAVLLKTGPLNDQEWQEMRTHPEKGYAIVSKITGMQDAAEIVLCHEERFDGSGYPRGLAGIQIPWGARLFAVIDTLDAMTSDRPYRKALTFEAAKDEIVRMSGTQFDPKVVSLFLEQESIMQEMVMLKCGTASIKTILNSTQEAAS